MTKEKKILHLIEIAKKRLETSCDPAHDLGHAQRVARYIEQFDEELKLGDKHKQALILAAWWHDISRTISSQPSFIMMVLIDDFLSALMLWRETIRYRLFGSVAGISTRLILCKSFGAGRLLTKIFLRKKTRQLLDILSDADNLDVLHTDRIEKIFPVVKRGKIYHWGYRILIWWNFHTHVLHLKTEVGKRHLKKMFKLLLIWIKNPNILAWHLAEFGAKWVEKTERNIKRLIAQLERLPVAHRY